MNRDVIAIGASAGGVEVLLDMVEGLPRDLPASLFVVVHVVPHHASVLPELLAARGKLKAKHPLHEEKIEPGTIYVAPPDNHLMLRHGAMQVVRGPKENGHRPAANALFRTASSAYGPRVIGVVLSGYLDCGTAGMMSIKARGGLSVVQNPDSAAAPDMPRSVLRHVNVDHVAEPRDLPALLTTLCRTEAGAPAGTDRAIDQLEGRVAGDAAGIVCPACQGALTVSESGTYEHFRCHVGHTFSLPSLIREQGDEMERALWSAVRALEESAALSRKLASSETGELRRRFTEKAETQASEAQRIRSLLLHGAGFTGEDAAKLV